MSLWPQDDLPYSRTVLDVVHMIATYDDQADDDGSLDAAMDALSKEELAMLRVIWFRISTALNNHKNYRNHPQRYRT